tara:strand:- start:12 stop:869 length:858 start_codon:yes stop_codon:yes gene_type:complete
MNIKNKTSFKEFKKQNIEKRFFKYDGFHDKIFVSPALFVSWICIRLKISANQVSWFSAFVAVCGAILISSQNHLCVFIGSFTYLLWYFLDYVDGSIARNNNTQSIEGQYIDWLMNVIATVSITAGVAIGAILVGGEWLIPFAILAILASVLSYDRNSMAWFSIVMEYQQEKTSSAKNFKKSYKARTNFSKINLTLKRVKKIIMLFFHENYMIFILPFLAFIQLMFLEELVDFRVILTILAGTLNFLVMVSLIHEVVKEKKASKAYNSLLIDDRRPNLPEDHFFDN